VTSSLRAWRGLSPAERRSTRGALLALPAVRAGLRLFGYRRCHRWMARRPLPPALSRDEALVTALREAVDRVARRLPGESSCLHRSLCLWWLLRRRGIATDLRIGVRKQLDGGLEGHAWVERDGCPVNDDANVGERYAPFEGTALPEIVRISP
jgi:Transglutaminase-like superfamily